MPDSDIPDDPSGISPARARDFPTEAVVSKKLRDQMTGLTEGLVGVPGEIRPLDRYIIQAVLSLTDAVYELEARYLSHR